MTPHDYLDLPDEDDFDGIPILRLNLLEALRARDLERLGEITQRVALEKRRFCPDLVHLNSVGLNAWLHVQTARVSEVPTLARMMAKDTRMKKSDKGCISICAERYAKQ